MTAALEINFDGLIGPTHNYGGLSLGNLASARNAGEIAHPRAAALQGLAKMRTLMELGLVQGILPPHERPHLESLHRLGFRGPPQVMLAEAYRADPALYLNLCSASAMWAANAATVSPSADTEDGRIHVTPANLASNLHRVVEADFTHRILKRIFADARHFAVHPPLPYGAALADEGAANHGRLCTDHGAAGVELFVYGETAAGGFPARQKRRASEAVARLHRLHPDRTLFLPQSKAAIDAGAFHNDVVSVANQHVLFAHEKTFEDRDSAVAALRAAFPDLLYIEARDAEVPLTDAISSYLFNSQLVTLPDGGGMALVLPAETQETPSVKAYLNRLRTLGGPIQTLKIVEVRESMKNGGGPACLRLRVAATPLEIAAMNAGFLLTETKLSALESWVSLRYRDDLSSHDLADPELHLHTLETLDQLTQLLVTGPLYDFQL